MGTSSISVRPYAGTLASLNIGGGINQNVLNAIGGNVGATINDDDGVLDANDDATFSLDGADTSAPVNYIGSGSISLINALGLKVFPRDISVFEVSGQIYLYLPEGLPPLSGVTLSIEIDADVPLDLPGFVPCFASGTRILTRAGNTLVEDIQAGDHVIDNRGVAHKVLWVGTQSVNLTALCEAHYKKLVPVRIRADRMGAQAPFTDLVVSQQHRIQVRHPLTETLFSLAECYAPAVALVGSVADFATDMTHVTYHHILCADHVTLLANGVEAESLFLGDVLRDGLNPALQEELRLVFPQFAALGQGDTYATALPTLKTYEARLLARLMARKSDHTPRNDAGQPPCADTRPLVRRDTPCKLPRPGATPAGKRLHPLNLH